MNYSEIPGLAPSGWAGSVYESTTEGDERKWFPVMGAQEHGLYETCQASYVDAKVFLSQGLQILKTLFHIIPPALIDLGSRMIPAHESHGKGSPIMSPDPE